MAGETQLEKLLASMQPMLFPDEFVFCNLPEATYSEIAKLNPIACFQEEEGWSLILVRTVADRTGLAYSSVFRRISLSVVSSLDAVGFTAAIAGKLAQHDISANVVAAHFPDHLFVPVDKADAAMQLLIQLPQE